MKMRSTLGMRASDRARQANNDPRSRHELARAMQPIVIILEDGTTVHKRAFDLTDLSRRDPSVDALLQQAVECRVGDKVINLNAS